MIEVLPSLLYTKISLLIYIPALSLKKNLLINECLDISLESSSEIENSPYTKQSNWKKKKKK